MIQRIQSLFLFLMALTMLSLLFFPIWIKANTSLQEMVILNAYNLRYLDVSTNPPTTLSLYQTYYISLLALLSAGVALFSLFSYTKRLRQIKLGALNSLIVGSIVICNYVLTTKGTAMMDDNNPAIYKIGFFIPVIALLFNSIANRFIRRDEKLIQASNRMR